MSDRLPDVWVKEKMRGNRREERRKKNADCGVCGQKREKSAPEKNAVNGEQIVGKDIGENSVKTTDDGKDVPYWGLPPIAVTKENMDSVIIDLGFHLHDEVYLNVSEESRD